jgi:hypothetical protein
MSIKIVCKFKGLGTIPYNFAEDGTRLTNFFFLCENHLIFASHKKAYGTQGYEASLPIYV